MNKRKEVEQALELGRAVVTLNQHLSKHQFFEVCRVALGLSQLEAKAFLALGDVVAAESVFDPAADF